MKKRIVNIILALLCAALILALTSCNRKPMPDYDTLYDGYFNYEDEMATLFLYFEKDPDITFRDANKAFSYIYEYWNSVVNPK